MEKESKRPCRQTECPNDPDDYTGYCLKCDENPYRDKKKIVVKWDAYLHCFIIDGVKVTKPFLKAITNPNQDYVYGFKREDNEVTVHTYNKKYYGIDQPKAIKLCGEDTCKFEEINRVCNGCNYKG